MKHQKTILILIVIIAVLSAIAASTGIFSDDGPGPYEYESIRGETVLIYGKGVYKQMSAEVAPQGIAQDVITLFIAIPLLLASLFKSLKGSCKSRFVLAGVLAYFFVTYLFYLVMAMYNELFLIYVILLGSSFFALALTLLQFDIKSLPDYFSEHTPHKPSGAFLIFNAIAIGTLWLEIIVPPFLDGSIIPIQAEHYTTLIVQGLDLAILLPLSFVSGLLMIRKKPMGYLLTPIYYVFLSLLMTALVAKILAMGMLGQNIVPVIFFIPVFTLISIYFSIRLLNECTA